MSSDGFAGFGALLTLSRLRVRGRLREAVAGLRRPKRLLLMLLGLLLVCLFAWSGTRGQEGGGNPIFSSEQGQLVLAAFLTFFLLSSAVGSIANGVLSFSPSEVCLLFPAPVSTRALIASYLLGGSLKSLTGSLVFTLFMRPGTAGWMRVLAGYLLVFETLTVLTLVIDLAHMHLPGPRRRRRALTWGLGVLLLAAATVLGTRWIDGRWSADVLRLVTAPGRLYAGVLNEQDPGTALADLAGALGILALLLARALSWRRPVRTGALLTSDRVQLRLKRFKHGGPIPDAPRQATGGRLLPMLPRWRGAGAHIWRQLTALRRKRKAFGILVAFSAVMAITMSVVGNHPRPEMGAMMAIFMLLFMGPFYVQCDFRADLDALPWLRSMPCSATALAAGELLASTIVLTGLEFLLGGWGVLMAGEGHLAGWIVGLLALPALNLMVLAVENGLYLLHPVRLDYSKGPPGATQIIGLYGAFLAKALLLAITVGLASLPGLGVGWVLDSPLAGLLVSLVAINLQAALLVVLVGRIFRGIDPGRDLLQD